MSDNLPITEEVVDLKNKNATVLNATKLDYTKATRKDVMMSWAAYEEYNNKVEELFFKERAEWEAMKREILHKIGDVDLAKIVGDLQVLNLAFRSQCTEKIAFYMNRLARDNVRMNRTLGDRREYYLTNFGLKTTDTQTKDMLNRDLSELKRSMEMMETHIEYIRENIKFSDQIGYAIKNKVEVHKLKYNE